MSDLPQYGERIVPTRRKATVIAFFATRLGSLRLAWLMIRVLYFFSTCPGITSSNKHNVFDVDATFNRVQPKLWRLAISFELIDAATPVAHKYLREGVFAYLIKRGSTSIAYVMHDVEG